MTLVELKNYITAGTVPSEFTILVGKDNSFLARQYLDAIGHIAAGGLNRVNSVYEPLQSTFSLLAAAPDCVNVVLTETFDERAEDYTRFTNTFVICDHVDKSISKAVEKHVIKLPKLEEWQMLDFAKTLCPVVEEEDLLWLINVSNNSIERVVNELDKVRLFDKNEQKQIFSAIQFDPQTDLYKVDLFAVVNGLVDGDLAVLYEFLRHKNYELLDPIMLANRALSSLKNIMLITQNRGLSAEDCGVSAAQYRAISYKYRSVNVNAVRSKIKFLTNVDLALKSSMLDLSKEAMLNYLVANLCYRIST